MRTLEKIESEILEKNRQISEIQNQVEEARETVSELKTGYSQAILGKTGNLDNHRDRLSLKNSELQGIEGVLEILESELLELQTEQSAAKLYTDVERHNSAMGQVDQAVSTVNEQLPKLTELVEELTGALQSCFSETPKACSSLSTIPRDLDNRFSLESFLSGQLEPATDDEDREALLEEIGQDLQSTVTALQIPGQISLTELERLINQVSQWRGIIESFQSGSALIRNKKVLVPELSKRPGTERITVPVIPRASHAVQMDFQPAPRFNRNKPAGQQFIGHRESF